jgi:hypothetical protein
MWVLVFSESLNVRLERAFSNFQDALLSKCKSLFSEGAISLQVQSHASSTQSFPQGADMALQSVQSRLRTVASRAGGHGV